MNIDEKYDFSDNTTVTISKNTRKNIEIENNKEYKDLSGFQKFLAYRLSTSAKKDPDNHSEKLQEVYKTRWDRYKDSCIERLCSDTMTSAQRLISEYYVKACMEQKSNEWEHYKKKNSCPKSPYPSAIAMEKILVERKKDKNKEIYKVFNEIFLDTSDKYKIVIEFINRYHTIGNYIPVPKYFNSKRSGYCAFHDMWDLTLGKIKDYYDEMKNNDVKSAKKTLMELLHRKKNDKETEEILNSTKEWLDSFKCWKNFIRENYLRDYIIEKEDWPIREEFTNFHDWKNPFPELVEDKDKNTDNYLEYIKELVNVINARADRILNDKK